jgi:SHS2 domain-containing protein
MSPKSTTVEHVGEWKLELTADTLEEIFAETARVIARAAGITARSTPCAWERVSVSSGSLTNLLADWANELVGRSEAAHRAYSEIRNVRVRMAPDRSVVSAELRGKPVKQWRSPLKAATYHSLALEPRARGWRGVILFDV